VTTRVRLLGVSLAGLVALTGCTGPTADDGPAPSPDTPAASPTRLPPVPKIPDTFPLAAGWPDHLRAPQRASLDLPGCQDDAGAPPNPHGTDRLVVHWPSASRDRQLTTYDDDAEAAAVADEVVAFYRACPVVDSQELPWRFVTSVRPAATGERSWVVVQALAIEGRPSGATVLLVVRAGRALLVDQVGFSYPADLAAAGFVRRLAREIDDQAHRGVSVVGAMCALTETRC
jgi:hypothetical protein